MGLSRANDEKHMQWVNTNCPSSLLGPLINIVIDEIRKDCKKDPIPCGFNKGDDAYEPLKLMQSVILKTNDVCKRYLENSELYALPPPGPPPLKTCVYAVKNSRRRMEDRHVIISDLNAMFNKQDASPSSYYAIFDGHAGHDAAVYSAAHLHQFLAENPYFDYDPVRALRDAFLMTDELFLHKCEVENFRSGTTAVCALLRPKEKTLYVAWVGDSQALLVNQGRVLQCVQPHKPSREDEKTRIEESGGTVIFWGIWRVNGQLAVSRAIGDLDYKPHVIADPDIRAIPLNGGEDFLIIACDGLWDHVSEDAAATLVYNMVRMNPDDIDSISKQLVQLSKEEGSGDNISVIVVFLRDPVKIAADAPWADRNGSTMEMEAGLDNSNNATNNPFSNSNGSEILSQKGGLLLDLADGFKQNGTNDSSPAAADGLVQGYQAPDLYNFLDRPPANGKRSADAFDEDDEFVDKMVDDEEDEDDFGPETDVDGIDDVLLSPTMTTQDVVNALHMDNNNPLLFGIGGGCTDIKEEEEGEDRLASNPFAVGADVSTAAAVATLEADLELQRQQTSEFDPVRESREETPTPPADEVLDGSGILENVAESGEDSEDEWNYYKGDQGQKENLIPADLQGNVSEPELELDQDAMSQLNPDAAEFVPVSPTRSIESPICRNLKDDQIVSQSPRRPTRSDMDINVPNPLDFDSEVKSRPSDVVVANGHENGHRLSSQEIMENLLNGKDVSEIEFHPETTMDQSEAFSTIANFGDESTASLKENINPDITTDISSITVPAEDTTDFQLLNRSFTEQDPMSTSFYVDKNDTETVNPFDDDALNKVQELPENLEDFLQDQENKKDNTDVKETQELINDVHENLVNVNTSEENKPAMTEGSVINDDMLSPSINPDVCPFAPIEPVAISCAIYGDGPLIDTKPQEEPISDTPTEFVRPIAVGCAIYGYGPPDEASKDIDEELIQEKSLTPEPGPHSQEIVEEASHTHVEESFMQEISSQIQTETVEIHQEPELVQMSPEPVSDVTHELMEETIAHSPVGELGSPVEDVTSSVKDDIISPTVASPIPDEVEKPVVLEEIKEVEMEITSIPAAVEECFIPSVETEKTVTESEQLIASPEPAESVAPSETSFLERSLIPEVTSPISPISTNLDISIPEIEPQTVTDILGKCEESEPSLPEKVEEPIVDIISKEEEVKVDIKLPEKPEELVITPDDVTATEVAAIAAAAGVAATAAVAAVAKATDKKSPAAAKLKSSTPSALKKTPAKSTSSTLKPTSTTKTAAATSTPKAASKTTSATKPTAKPRTPLSAPRSTAAELKSAEKAKAAAAPVAAKPPPIRRPVPGAAKPPPTAAAPKPAPPKPADAAPKTRPITAATRTVSSSVAPRCATTAKTATSNGIASKPRVPATATTRLSTTTKTTTSNVTASRATSATKTTATSAPKPRTAPITRPSTTRPATAPISKAKGPDAEKLLKETTNKQLSASRAATTRTTLANRTTSSTLSSATAKKASADGKITSTRTTVTKTTSRTATTAGTKKPTEVTRTTKTTTIKSPTKPQQNGTADPHQNGISTETVVVKELTTVLTSDEPILIKDNSPIENSTNDNIASALVD